MSDVISFVTSLLFIACLIYVPICAIAVLARSLASPGDGKEDFKHLRWFADNLAKGRFTGIVLYAGEDTLPFGDGFYAVPLAALGA